MTWDLFISYAAEDKPDVAVPLVTSLLKHGLRVWFDELVLQPGARLRESIDAGLADCRFAVLILSYPYMKKNWTRYEFDGLVQRFVSRQVTLSRFGTKCPARILSR